ncbi:glycosyl transferase family 1 [Chromobacterium sp. ATCC 53434]|uniref:glycosyltransferase family 4 protein n=1 Tax=Chromobacterium TaxID=535 RepID=UPI000C770E59|nr:glycosyltransferase family 4 protein [Chromobacterium sp. ATCC 53434]AUH51617.1 glycosyl transferase family 1 [Chromobacterium sp. ATCC 53434]
MKLLFIHQNFPGQFCHLLAPLWQSGRCDVMGLGERRWVAANLGRLPAGMPVVGYDMPSSIPGEADGMLRTSAQAIARGQQVAAALLRLRKQGYCPDVVYAHPGWGESLFVKDVFPAARLVHYCEFFYRVDGQDVGFDPEFPDPFEERLRLRSRTSHHLLSLDAMDLGISATEWQRQCFPSAYRDRIEVVHDGVDTSLVRPDPAARLTLPDGRVLSAADEVVTFVNRNLEPYRGFHSFMRALPRLQRLRPDAQILIVGGDEVSYGKQAPPGYYRQRMLDEVGDGLKPENIHFLGKVPYDYYLRLLQVSTAHVYLTYPFVLSWSMLEAMACGGVVIGSRTAPVEEVIDDGCNGLLVDFFSPDEIADVVADVCRQRHGLTPLRQAARQSVVESYDLHDVCLPRQLRLLGLAN